MDEFHPPPKKKYPIYGILSFFHTFFALSCHVRRNTCSKVMILHSSGKSMLLNTFLILFRCQNNFGVLSDIRNQHDSHTKKRQSPSKFGMNVGVCLVNHVDFLCLRARKIYFGTKRRLEACSAKSTYP